MRLTESRSGGTVATGCTACGKPGYIMPSGIPAIKCTQCLRDTKLTYDAYGSFQCVCDCGGGFLLVQVLPEWAVHFDNDGAGAAPDLLS